MYHFGGSNSHQVINSNNIHYGNDNRTPSSGTNQELQSHHYMYSNHHQIHQRNPTETQQKESLQNAAVESHHHQSFMGTASGTNRNGNSSSTAVLRQWRRRSTTNQMKQQQLSPQQLQPASSPIQHHHSTQQIIQQSSVASHQNNNNVQQSQQYLVPNSSSHIGGGPNGGGPPPQQMRQHYTTNDIRETHHHPHSNPTKYYPSTSPAVINPTPVQQNLEQIVDDVNYYSRNDPSSYGGYSMKNSHQQTKPIAKYPQMNYGPTVPYPPQISGYNKPTVINPQSSNVPTITQQISYQNHVAKGSLYRNYDQTNPELMRNRSFTNETVPPFPYDPYSRAQQKLASISNDYYHQMGYKLPPTNVYKKPPYIPPPQYHHPSPNDDYYKYQMAPDADIHLTSSPGTTNYNNPSLGGATTYDPNWLQCCSDINSCPKPTPRLPYYPEPVIRKCNMNAYTEYLKDNTKPIRHFEATGEGPPPGSAYPQHRLRYEDYNNFNYPSNVVKPQPVTPKYPTSWDQNKNYCTTITDKYPFHGYTTNSLPAGTAGTNPNYYNPENYLAPSSMPPEKPIRYHPNILDPYNNYSNKANFLYPNWRMNNGAQQQQLQSTPNGSEIIDFENHIKVNELAARTEFAQKSKLNLKEFLETWDENEETEENQSSSHTINNLPDVVLSNKKLAKADDDNMLYILESTNIPEETVWSDYKHLQQIDKLPDNIKLVEEIPKTPTELIPDKLQEFMIPETPDSTRCDTVIKSPDTTADCIQTTIEDTLSILENDGGDIVSSTCSVIKSPRPGSGGPESKLEKSVIGIKILDNSLVESVTTTYNNKATIIDFETKDITNYETPATIKKCNGHCSFVNKCEQCQTDDIINELISPRISEICTQSNLSHYSSSKCEDDEDYYDDDDLENGGDRDDENSLNSISENEILDLRRDTDDDKRMFNFENIITKLNADNSVKSLTAICTEKYISEQFNVTTIAIRHGDTVELKMMDNDKKKTEVNEYLALDLSDRRNSQNAECLITDVKEFPHIKRHLSADEHEVVKNPKSSRIDTSIKNHFESQKINSPKMSPSIAFIESRIRDLSHEEDQNDISKMKLISKQDFVQSFENKDSRQSLSKCSANNINSDQGESNLENRKAINVNISNDHDKLEQHIRIKITKNTVEDISDRNSKRCNQNYDRLFEKQMDIETKCNFFDGNNMNVNREISFDRDIAEKDSINDVRTSADDDCNSFLTQQSDNSQVFSSSPSRSSEISGDDNAHDIEMGLSSSSPQTVSDNSNDIGMQQSTQQVDDVFPESLSPKTVSEKCDENCRDIEEHQSKNIDDIQDFELPNPNNESKDDGNSHTMLSPSISDSEDTESSKTISDTDFDKQSENSESPIIEIPSPSPKTMDDVNINSQEAFKDIKNTETSVIKTPFSSPTLVSASAILNCDEISEQQSVINSETIGIPSPKTLTADNSVDIEIQEQYVDDMINGEEIDIEEQHVNNIRLEINTDSEIEIKKQNVNDSPVETKHDSEIDIETDVVNSTVETRLGDEIDIEKHVDNITIKTQIAEHTESEMDDDKTAIENHVDHANNIVTETQHIDEIGTETQHVDDIVVNTEHNDEMDIEKHVDDIAIERQHGDDIAVDTEPNEEMNIQKHVDKMADEEHVDDLAIERQHGDVIAVDIEPNEEMDLGKHVDTIADEKHVDDIADEKHVDDIVIERQHGDDIAVDTKPNEEMNIEKHVDNIADEKHVDDIADEKHVDDIAIERQHGDDIAVDTKPNEEMNIQIHVDNIADEKHVDDLTIERQHGNDIAVDTKPNEEMNIQKHVDNIAIEKHDKIYIETQHEDEIVVDKEPNHKMDIEIHGNNIAIEKHDDEINIETQHVDEVAVNTKTNDEMDIEKHVDSMAVENNDGEIDIKSQHDYDIAGDIEPNDKLDIEIHGDNIAVETQPNEIVIETQHINEIAVDSEHNDEINIEKQNADNIPVETQHGDQLDIETEQGVGLNIDDHISVETAYHNDEIASEKQHVDDTTKETQHDEIVTEGGHVENNTSESEHNDKSADSTVKTPVGEIHVEKQHIEDIIGETKHNDEMDIEKQRVDNIVTETPHDDKIYVEKQHADEVTVETGRDNDIEISNVDDIAVETQDKDEMEIEEHIENIAFEAEQDNMIVETQSDNEFEIEKQNDRSGESKYQHVDDIMFETQPDNEIDIKNQHVEDKIVDTQCGNDIDSSEHVDDSFVEHVDNIVVETEHDDEIKHVGNDSTLLTCDYSEVTPANIPPSSPETVDNGTDIEEQSEITNFDNPKELETEENINRKWIQLTEDIITQTKTSKLFHPKIFNDFRDEENYCATNKANLTMETLSTLCQRKLNEKEVIDDDSISQSPSPGDPEIYDQVSYEEVIGETLQSDDENVIIEENSEDSDKVPLPETEIAEDVNQDENIILIVESDECDQTNETDLLLDNSSTIIIAFNADDILESNNIERNVIAAENSNVEDGKDIEEINSDNELNENDSERSKTNEASDNNFEGSKTNETSENDSEAIIEKEIQLEIENILMNASNEIENEELMESISNSPKMDDDIEDENPNLWMYTEEEVISKFDDELLKEFSTSTEADVDESNKITTSEFDGKTKESDQSDNSEKFDEVIYSRKRRKSDDVERTSQIKTEDDSYKNEMEIMVEENNSKKRRLSNEDEKSSEIIAAIEESHAKSVEEKSENIKSDNTIEDIPNKKRRKTDDVETSSKILANKETPEKCIGEEFANSSTPSSSVTENKSDQVSSSHEHQENTSRDSKSNRKKFKYENFHGSCSEYERKRSKHEGKTSKYLSHPYKQHRNYQEHKSKQIEKNNNSENYSSNESCVKNVDTTKMAANSNINQYVGQQRMIANYKIPKLSSTSTSNSSTSTSSKHYPKKDLVISNNHNNNHNFNSKTKSSDNINNNNNSHHGIKIKIKNLSDYKSIGYRHNNNNNNNNKMVMEAGPSNHNQYKVIQKHSSSYPNTTVPKVIIKRETTSSTNCKQSEENNIVKQQQQQQQQQNMFTTNLILNNAFKWQPFVRIVRNTRIDRIAVKLLRKQQKIILKINRVNNNNYYHYCSSSSSNSESSSLSLSPSSSSSSFKTSSSLSSIGESSTGVSFKCRIKLDKNMLPAIVQSTEFKKD